MKIFFYVLLLTLATSAVSDARQESYSGSAVCQTCHAEQYELWQLSDHFKAMQIADTHNVLGDFSNITTHFHNIKSRLFTRNQKFWINTLGKDGQYQDFEISHTFGHYPLQQYLVTTDNGHIQALNIAWDSRSEADGGQRWFHLQPKENIDQHNPFFWTGHFQNWNSRCAECHTTGLVKNYRADNNSYDTRWSEMNVACEACHGPGEHHVKLARTNKLTAGDNGLLYQSVSHLSWAFQENDPIAKPSGKSSAMEINMCGGCHSRRMPLQEPSTNSDYHNTFRLALLQHGLYFSDGQINDEVFVLGSFLQSKMHQQGVTCSNCHNPHSGKLLAEDNNLCAQCHKPSVYNQSSHHHHAKNSEGSQCVNCHMPARHYMQVDARRDHSFMIPRPELSSTTDTPNTCLNCHTEKDNAWSNKTMRQWGIKKHDDHWAQLNHSARSLDPLRLPSLIEAINDSSLSNIVRATLHQHLANFPSRVATLTAQQGLLNDDPLIRRAAVFALSQTPAQTRWQLLSPHFNDPSRSVRFEIAVVMSELYSQLPQPLQLQLKTLIDEYRQTLSLSQDSPSSQTSIATLELHLGERGAALQAFQRALIIDPTHLPSLLNLSEFYRQAGDAKREDAFLKKALKIYPESAAVQHAVALHLVRQKNYHAALVHLKKATQLDDAQPRYAYIYAVALDGQGNTREALQVLQRAGKRWPNQYDLLTTEILYLEKLGNTMAIYRPLAALSRVAPNAPQVKQWLSKYQK